MCLLAFKNTLQSKLHTMANAKKTILPYSKDGDRDQDEKLLQPFAYILQVPGKNIRSKLSHAFNYWLRIPEDKVIIVGDIIQILHNASLFLSLSPNVTRFKEINAIFSRLDDIEDSSILRRGIPVAHSIFGVASTINAANYVMVIALEKCLELNIPEATSVYTEQLLELHRGQGMEIYWRDNFICPTEEEYSKMTMKKTGGLFMLAIRLMQLFSDNKDDFTKLASILGLYFQIRDDYINLCSKDYMQNKSYCEDLTEGKFSFPLIHAIRSQPQESQVMQILRQRTKDNEVKRYCVTLLEKYGSFEYTRQKLKDLDREVREEMTKFPPNPYIQQFLDTVMKLID